MKTCPYCAEEIQDAAIVCKHCGRDLKTGALPMQPTQTIKVRQADWISTTAKVGCAGILVLVVVAWCAGSILSPTRSPASSGASPSASAGREAELRDIVVSAGESCDRAVRSFHQGTDPKLGDWWNVACANGKAYAIQIQGRRTKVLDCAVLKAVSKVDCFVPFASR